MSHSTASTLKIGGDSISVLLIEPPDETATVTITWPSSTLSAPVHRSPRCSVDHTLLRRREHAAVPEQGR